VELGRQGRVRLRREAERASVDSVELCKSRKDVLFVRECTAKLSNFASILISAGFYFSLLLIRTPDTMGWLWLVQRV
jgi:hypothetical protein